MQDAQNQPQLEDAIPADRPAAPRSQDAPQHKVRTHAAAAVLT